jgi:hypothetical protein
MRRVAATLVSLVLACAALPAPAAQDARARRLKVGGTWDGQMLRAVEMEERDASKDADRGQVEGTVGAIDLAQRRMHIGPFTVTWDDATEFEDLTLESLAAGATVEASGAVGGPRLLHATAIESGSDDLGPDVVEIIGAVEPVDDGAVAILGVPVVLPPAGGRRSALTVRGDDRRPEDQLTIRFLDRPLVFGGELGVVSRMRDNFDLDGTERLVRGDLEAQLELFYPFAEHAAAFVEVKAFNEAELYQRDGDRETERALERGEMWVYLDGFWEDRLALQIGRQNFADEREWWWDQDLDALRVYVNLDRWNFEVAAARELGRISTLSDLEPEDQDVARVLGRMTWHWRDRHSAELYFLSQDDRSARHDIGGLLPEDDVDESDADLTWFGLRAMGKTESGDAGKFQYWVDTALLRGHDEITEFDTDDDDVATIEGLDRHDVRGWAVDFGASWTLPFEWEPTLTLGYAIGSGDDPDTAKDESFRQTGLDNNNTKFRGVDRFRIYGELLDPELANLAVSTISFGKELGDDRSVEIVYHRYRLRREAEELRDVRIDADMTGESRDVGQGIDLVLGLEHWKHVELELIGSAFRAGDAFGDLSGEWAYGLIAKFNYNF